MEFALRKPSAKSVGWFVYMVVIVIAMAAPGWWLWNNFTTTRQAFYLERDLGLLSAKLIQEFKSTRVAGEMPPQMEPELAARLATSSHRVDTLSNALLREPTPDDPALAEYLRVAAAELRALLLARRATHPALDEDQLCETNFQDGATFPLACATSVLDSGSYVAVGALDRQLAARWRLDDEAHAHRREMSDMDRIVAERRSAPANVRGP